MSMGGGKSQSTADAQGSSTVWDQQAPFLQNLYGQAQGVAGQQMGQIGGASQALSGQLMGQGGQMLGNLGQSAGIGAGVGAAGLVGGLGAMGELAMGRTQGQQVMARQASGSSPVLGQQINQLGGDLSRFFSQQIMPGLQGEAVSVNGMGNARQGIAQGMAAQSMGDAFQRGVTDLYSADYSNQLGAAQSLTGSQMQGAQGLGQLGIGAMGQGTAAGAGGLGSLSGLYGLGMSPFDAQFSPLQRLAGLLGPAIMEGQNTSTSQSSSFNVSGGW